MLKRRRNNSTLLGKRGLKNKLWRFLRASFCLSLVAALVAVEGTNSYFSDIETSSLEMEAGTLEVDLRSGQTNFSPADRAIELKAGEYVARDVYVQKEGSLPMRYGAKITKDSACDQDLFENLDLKVYYNFYHTKEPDYPSYHSHRTMRQLFSGKLSDFEFNDIVPNLDEQQIPNEHEHFNNRFYDEDEHWLYFRVELPLDADSSLQDKTCAFDFDFEAWQVSNTDASSGFHDSASLSSVITTSDWTAPKKIQEMTIFRGHNSDSENEVGCRGYTNDTRIRIDWEDSEADDIDYYWFGTRRNSKHKKIDASKSYYDGNITPGNAPYFYTVIAVDKNGNESEVSDSCGNLVLDTEAPEVSFDNISSGGILSGEFEIHGSLTDDNPKEYKVSIVNAAGITVEDSGIVELPATLSNYPILDWNTTKVENGNYIVTFSATDFAGNFRNISILVEVANSKNVNQKPTVKIVSPNQDEDVANTLEVIGNVTDDNLKECWVEIEEFITKKKIFPLKDSLDKLPMNKSVTNFTFTLFNTQDVADGLYKIKLFAKDKDGNESSDEVTVTFLNGTSGQPNDPLSVSDEAKENVVINEFLPDPESGDEFVELYNKSANKAFDLADWYIGDEKTLKLVISDSSTTSGSTEIGPEDYLVLELSSSKLNNDGDTVEIFNRSGNKIDSKSYNDSTKGKSYQRIPDGESDWEQATPTKNAKNEADSDSSGTTASVIGTRMLAAPAPLAASEKAPKAEQEESADKGEEEEKQAGKQEGVEEEEKQAAPEALEVGEKPVGTEEGKEPGNKEDGEENPAVEEQPAKLEDDEPEVKDKEESTKDDKKEEKIREEPATKPEKKEGEEEKGKEEEPETEKEDEKKETEPKDPKDN